MKTAILIDGGFYRKVAIPAFGYKNPEESAKELYSYCVRHLTENLKNEQNIIKHELYKIFYYDCKPLNKQVFHPYLQKTIDLSKTDEYKWMNKFLEELKKKRKVVIRLGEISDISTKYILKEDIQKKLMSGIFKLEDIRENDFKFVAEQKGVDMKIGLDIALMSFKKQVNQIVLIAGDSDFVPASKLARREGIDFILDPLGRKIKENLFEHIDGMRWCDNRLKNQFKK